MTSSSDHRGHYSRLSQEKKFSTLRVDIIEPKLGQGNILRNLYRLSHFIHITDIGGKYYYHAHFSDEETWTQRN